MKKKEISWSEGNRAFYWTSNYKHPLCLQSKQYNGNMKGRTWVYYSNADAKKLYLFLKNIFNDSSDSRSESKTIET